MIKKAVRWISLAINYVSLFGVRSFVSVLLDDNRENKLKRRSLKRENKNNPKEEATKILPLFYYPNNPKRQDTKYQIVDPDLYFW